MRRAATQGAGAPVSVAPGPQHLPAAVRRRVHVVAPSPAAVGIEFWWEGVGMAEIQWPSGDTASAVQINSLGKSK